VFSGLGIVRNRGEDDKRVVWAGYLILKRLRFEDMYYVCISVVGDGYLAYYQVILPGV
jgi:hypothetical protein